MSPVRWIAELPWNTVLIACFTLGLAPFTPPHIVEKLKMLRAGTLSKPIDWFDLVMHGAPWALLVAKGVIAAVARVG